MNYTKQNMTYFYVMLFLDLIAAKFNGLSIILLSSSEIENIIEWNTMSVK